MWIHTLVIGVITLALAGTSLAADRGVDLGAWARLAVAEERVSAVTAIQSLRAAGPAGLQTMFAVHGDLIAEVSAARAVPTSEWKLLSAALDQVAQQRDAWASGLYWYTDLDLAKRVAAKEGKPILSLRLLGNLNEELSCANSRFFRTVLYPDRDVAAYLRDHYILHWQSVRPVPRVTIDFGDGRRIERTITGNSIHYILSADGTIVDALPGLYSPARFLTVLVHADNTHRATATMEDAKELNDRLKTLHQRIAAELEAEWNDGMRRVGVSPRPIPVVAGAGNAPPPAMRAAARTTSKTAVEIRTLRQIALEPDNAAEIAALNNQTWAALATLHPVKLDPVAQILIDQKHASRATLGPLLARFQQSIAEDTVRNEFMLRRELHRWLAEDPQVALDAFNERVYAELFLTPNNDPWLGLAPADVFTALFNEGLIEPEQPFPQAVSQR